MPWLKTSDKAPFHPLVLGSASLDVDDPRLVNEIFGFAARCAAAASAHLTDYIVHIGVAMQFAGPRGRALIEDAVAAGYLSWTTTKDHTGNTTDALKLLEDEDLFHMRLKEEVEWDRQRARDRKGALQAQMRQRDGDACRYCGKSVQPNDTMTGRGWEIDHLEPGERIKSPADIVVACRACNASLGDMPRDQREKKLLDPPETPLYGAYTAQILERFGLSMDRGTRLAGGPEAADGKKDATPPNEQPAQGGLAGTTAGAHSRPGIGTEDGRPHIQWGSDPADATAGHPDAPTVTTGEGAGTEGEPETSGVPASTTPQTDETTQPRRGPQALADGVVSRSGPAGSEGEPADVGVPASSPTAREEDAQPPVPREEPEPSAPDQRPGSGPPDDKSHDESDDGTATRPTALQRSSRGIRAEGSPNGRRSSGRDGPGRAGAGLSGPGLAGTGRDGPARQARPAGQGARRKRRR